jgi:hypothetical protein
MIFSPAPAVRAGRVPCLRLCHEVIGVCVPGLRRNRYGQRQEELMTAPQRSLYRFLRQKMQQPQMPVTDQFPMPQTGADGSSARKRSSEHLHIERGCAYRAPFTPESPPALRA